ncbi:hypothetical protein B4096_0850 [Heyndrickxia coagulans]|nr:hypothetical protein B4096_0850 [Heyndrickxia coagulans]
MPVAHIITIFIKSTEQENKLTTLRVIHLSLLSQFIFNPFSSEE